MNVDLFLIGVVIGAVIFMGFLLVVFVAALSQITWAACAMKQTAQEANSDRDNNSGRSK